jgi:NAD(P)-dependent dehydrogenase (short-subunit alcohol dehydrogenase family)
MSDKVLEAKPILERFRLDGRVALVTGGAMGIGRAFAHALGEAGAAVAIADIDTEGAEVVVGELKDKGIDAIGITADVSQADQVQAMVDAVMDKWGKLTIGVNNAGIGQWHPAEDILEADWDKIMAIDLKGVFLCAQVEGRIMMEAGYGKIINTASMSGSIVNIPQQQTVYNTAKAGCVHLTKCLGTEWITRGVRVNSISPGYTKTKMVEDLLDTPIGKEVLPVWMSMTPIHEMCLVTDLQGAVVFLASEASDYMTGHDLIIDGGYCAW